MTPTTTMAPINRYPSIGLSLIAIEYFTTTDQQTDKDMKRALPHDSHYGWREV